MQMFFTILKHEPMARVDHKVRMNNWLEVIYPETSN